MDAERPKKQLELVFGFTKSWEKLTDIYSDDLPDPESPVMTMNLSRGISTVMFFKL